ncbi:MAG: hypothetical protein WCP32_09290 [Bacteroidota bacterium]
MKKVLVTFIIVFSTFFAIGQEFVVKNYKYRLVSTELSPKEAIQQARKEALTACVQENLGAQVMNLTRLEKQENNLQYMEKFNDFTQQISNGYVRRFKIKDTISTYDPNTLSLETRITMDVTLYKPENDNEVGLFASTDKSTYRNEESAAISYSLKKPAYFYLFDLNYLNQYCLVYETREPMPADQPITFPDQKMIFQLTMAKGDENAYEFGSFVVIAAVKPVNFGVPAGVDNNWKCSYIEFDRFFQVISEIKKDYSIAYLPYCIE